MTKKVPLKFTHIVIVLETVGDQIVFVFNVSRIIIASSRYQEAREDIFTNAVVKAFKETLEPFWVI